MNKLKRIVFRVIKVVIAVLFVWLSLHAFDLQYILKQVSGIVRNGYIVLAMVICYFLAFVLKAKAWQLYINQSIGFKPYLDGVFYSLFVNHLLPIKGGELVRVGYLAQWKKVGWGLAFSSVVTMRMLDIALLGSVALIGTIYLGLSISLVFVIVLLSIIIGIVVIIFGMKPKWWSILLNQLHSIVYTLWSPKGIFLFCLIIVSWCLEAVVLLAVTTQFGISVSYLASLWVNSFTIAGQVFHFSPGGIGTYESFMSFALTNVNVHFKEAYAIAIVTHGFKFLFSFGIGLYLLLFAPISLNKLSLWLKRKED